jgi:Lipase (class 3)
MPSALRYITKDSHPEVQQLSSARGIPIRGRRYDPTYASKPSGGIQINELIQGAQYAFVSIVDDKLNTLHKVGKANPWYLRVMKMIIPHKDQIHLPLSQLLPMEPFQLHTIDEILDISGYTKAGHALDTQGYIAHNDTTIVLAYRCTTSAKDWVTNLSMTTSAWEIDTDVQQGHSGFFSSCADYACCTTGFDTTIDGSTGTTGGTKPRVHTGFYNNFLVTVPSIRKYIDPLLLGDNQPPRTLYVVGHSLGAGIAMMAACYFIMEPQYQQMWRNTASQHRLRVVTVGGPRACCQSMQEQVDTVLRELRPTNKVQVLQLVRDKDCVPTVPPELFGFRHLHEKTVYITKEDETTGQAHILINPDTRQVIHRKKFRQLLKEKPEVFAPYIVPTDAAALLGGNASNIKDVENNDGDDNDVESVSDMEDLHATQNTDDKDTTDFDDTSMSEAEWIERYNHKIKMVPRAFRDHMPDFYYQPLITLQQTLQTNEAEKSTGGKGASTAVNKGAVVDTEETVTNSSECDEEDAGVPYQSLNSHESSVCEVPISKPSRFHIFGGRWNRK